MRQFAEEDNPPPFALASLHLLCINDLQHYYYIYGA